MDYQFLLKMIDDIYIYDQKKLKTGTILYGHLEEHRWHTRLQAPLSVEKIFQLQSELGSAIPSSYKDFLSSYNGCYLFDLVSMAGYVSDYKDKI